MPNSPKGRTGPIQYVGHKMEFAESGVTLGHEKEKDGKRTKTGVSNAQPEILTVEAAKQPC